MYHPCPSESELTLIKSVPENQLVGATRNSVQSIGQLAIQTNRRIPMNGRLKTQLNTCHTAVSSAQIYGGNQIWRKSQLNIAVATIATTENR